MRQQLPVHTSLRIDYWGQINDIFLKHNHKMQNSRLKHNHKTQNSRLKHNHEMQNVPPYFELLCTALFEWTRNKNAISHVAEDERPTLPIIQNGGMGLQQRGA